MKGEVRWGLLSTAKINRHIIPAIRKSKRGNLVAVASRNSEKAKHYATEWGIANAFGSYVEMLVLGNIDAVYISLPNHLHAKWTIKSLNEGKHVLCEKPLALSVDEINLMESASLETDRRLAEALMYRHLPQIKEARKWVRNGRLGNISLVVGTFTFLPHGENNIRLVREYGGGSLWDIGIYAISLAQFILGTPPSTVVGIQKMYGGEVDISFAGLLGYADGAIGEVRCSFALPFNNAAQIVGSEGRLELDSPFQSTDRDSSMVFHDRSGELSLLDAPKLDAYQLEIEDMNAAILDDEPNFIKLEESRGHIATLQVLYRAAAEGTSTEVIDF